MKKTTKSRITPAQVNRAVEVLWTSLKHVTATGGTHMQYLNKLECRGLVRRALEAALNDEV